MLIPESRLVPEKAVDIPNAIVESVTPCANGTVTAGAASLDAAAGSAPRCPRLNQATHAAAAMTPAATSTPKIFSRLNTLGAPDDWPDAPATLRIAECCELRGFPPNAACAAARSACI